MSTLKQHISAIKDGFKDGIKSVFNLSPSQSELRKFYQGPEQDHKNLAQDWQNVGGYIRSAMNQMDRELQAHPDHSEGSADDSKGTKHGKTKKASKRETEPQF